MSLRVGLVGCGNISEIYLVNAGHYTSIDLVACADLDQARAQAKATAHGIAALGLDELLADRSIDIVLNLTPAQAHAEVSLAAIARGKHVYTEKPLAVSAAQAAEILDRAQAAGLRVGAAPDTMLGANIQGAARLLDEGGLGRVIFGTAGVLTHGMEHWHPDPRAFYALGGGPVLDLGPYYVSALVTLLGPVSRVQAVACVGNERRMVTTEGSHLKGQGITPEVPTTASSLLEFAGGGHATLVASWDVWAHGHPMLELHTTGGALRLADPNWFGGPIVQAQGRGGWTETRTDDQVFGRPNWTAAGQRVANYRGLGLAEMASAIERGRPHQASGELAHHVLQVLLAIAEAAATGQAVTLPSTRCTPPRLTDEAARALWRQAN